MVRRRMKLIQKLPRHESNSGQICSVCNSLLCKYCQNDHVCQKGNLIKCYAKKQKLVTSRSKGNEK